MHSTLKLAGIQRTLIKTIKIVKDYSYRVRLEKLGLTSLQETKIRGYLIETFKIINGISNCGRHFFNISPQTGYFLLRQILKSTNRSNFFANRIIYFWNKLPNQMKSSNSVKKTQQIILDDFRNNIKKKYLRWHFWKLLYELLNRIRFVYRYFINNLYVLCKNSFFFLLMWGNSKKNSKLNKTKHNTQNKKQNNTQLSVEDDPLRTVQEIEIWPYNQIVHAQTGICPGEWDAQNSLGFWDINRSPNPGSKTRPSDSR